MSQDCSAFCITFCVSPERSNVKAEHLLYRKLDEKIVKACFSGPWGSGPGNRCRPCQCQPVGLRKPGCLGCAFLSKTPNLLLTSCPLPIFTAQHIFLFYFNSRFATGHNSQGCNEEYISGCQGACGPQVCTGCPRKRLGRLGG